MSQAPSCVTSSLWNSLGHKFKATLKCCVPVLLDYFQDFFHVNIATIVIKHELFNNDFR